MYDWDNKNGDPIEDIKIARKNILNNDIKEYYRRKAQEEKSITQAIRALAEEGLSARQIEQLLIKEGVWPFI